MGKFRSEQKSCYAPYPDASPIGNLIIFEGIFREIVENSTNIGEEHSIHTDFFIHGSIPNWIAIFKVQQDEIFITESPSIISPEITCSTKTCPFKKWCFVVGSSGVDFTEKSYSKDAAPPEKCLSSGPIPGYTG